MRAMKNRAVFFLVGEKGYCGTGSVGLFSSPAVGHGARRRQADIIGWPMATENIIVSKDEPRNRLAELTICIARR